MEAYIGYGGGEGWFGRIVFGSEEAVHGGCLVGFVGSSVAGAQVDSGLFGLRKSCGLSETRDSVVRGRGFATGKMDDCVFIWEQE